MDCKKKAIIGKDLDKAIALLTAGELVAIPTETVYGLGGNAFSESAIQKIYAVKNRPLSNPLIVHLANSGRLESVARDIPEMAYKLLEEFSPGPLTLLLNKKDSLPEGINSGLSKVAVRIPAHELTLELLERLAFPLAAPSANPFGYISPTTPEHVYKQLGDKIEYILDGGPCCQGIESTVLGFEEGIPVVYRLGALSVEAIRHVAGEVKLITAQHAETTPSPGMLAQHYSPHTAFVFTEHTEQMLEQYNTERTGLLRFSNYLKNVPEKNQFVLSPEQNLEEAARNLYAALHFLDEQKFDVIIAEKFPETGIGSAINDRLRRAAAKK